MCHPEEPVRREEHHEGIQDRASSGAQHLVEAERQVPRRLTRRGVNEPEGPVVGEKPDGYTRVSKEAVELRRRGVVEGSGLGFRAIQVQSFRLLPDKEERQSARARRLAEGKRGLKDLRTLGDEERVLVELLIQDGFDRVAEQRPKELRKVVA